MNHKTNEAFTRNSKPSGKVIGEDKKAESEGKGSEPATSLENQNSALVADPGWNEQNWQSADNPGNLVGRPPGKNFDYGAGSNNFSFTAPVVSLPGRGVDLSLGLTYNSRLWNKNGYELTYDIDRGFPAPGWSLGFGKILDMGEGGRSMMVEPDGTRHSFDGTPGYNGTSFSGYTTDGTFINYNSRRVSDGIYSAQAALPNGTFINYTARGDGAVYPTYIRDRHGNYLTITYRNNRGPDIETVTDTMGRVVTFNYDSLDRLISITAPRMRDYGGIGTRTLVRLHYKTQPISYNFASYITPAVRNSSPYVIDAIYYPATNTGYWFGDADSYSTYGNDSQSRRAARNELVGERGRTRRDFTRNDDAAVRLQLPAFANQRDGTRARRKFNGRARLHNFDKYLGRRRGQYSNGTDNLSS